MFLKEKGDFYIKARREGSKKRYAISKMVSLEAIMTTSWIGAAKERDVAVVDIPGEFLTTDTDMIVHMVVHGRIAELTEQVNP